MFLNCITELPCKCFAFTRSSVKQNTDLSQTLVTESRSCGESQQLNAMVGEAMAYSCTARKYL